MSRRPVSIVLSESERAQLENWVRQPKNQARYAERARIILWAAQVLSNLEIAHRLDHPPARICKWPTRFDQKRLAGLADDFRPGKSPIYDERSRQRLLNKLDEDPPKSFSSWTGPLRRRVEACSLGSVTQ